MKRLLQILASTALIIGVTTVSASAAITNNNCVITGTGPDSINSCTFDESNNMTVVCTNGMIITTVCTSTLSWITS